MFTEKKRLIDKRPNPFYGSYKELSDQEEIHWQNKKKKKQLCIVSLVISILVILAIGIVLAITLPDIFGRTLTPPDPSSLPEPSPSLLGQYNQAGISSSSGHCSSIGRKILETLNSSAVDAAIATVLCLGVTAPQSGGLGGGFFMVLQSEDGSIHTLNARETAPMNVMAEDFVQKEDSINGGMAVGVPGELAGLWEAHQRFGRVPWAELVRPARELALNGFPVEQQLALALEKFGSRIRKDHAMSSEFINPETDSLWKEGDILFRPRLGQTLNLIELNGMEIFYNGSLARTIVDEVVTEAGGILTLEDLDAYTANWEEPISYELNNTLTLYGPPFPSSAPVVALAIGILDGLGKKESKTTQELGEDAHTLAEVLKFASAIRGQVADPAYVIEEDLTMLMDKLLSVEYSEELRGKILPFKTFHDPAYYGATFATPVDSGTAHVSIIGPRGDAVSLTTTINLSFGAGFMGNETGIIYNNEMNDFSFPNTTDPYGLPYNPNNMVEPGKRPASSMSPLLFLNEANRTVLATGATGGANIVPALITATWRALYRMMDIKQAIDFPRFVPDFGSNEILYEFGLPSPIVEDLRRKGHRMKRRDNSSNVGSVNSVCVTKISQLVLANADWRKHGDSDGF